MQAFHYAFKVMDLPTTRAFYVDLLGCEEGRSTETWVDFNFFGHQLSAHLSYVMPERDYCGLVDGTLVPIPHFGCLLDLADFNRIAQQLEQAPVEFLIKPKIRYEGLPGEQMCMFVLDYSGNPIEFKSYTHAEEVFAKIDE